jgi:thiamine-phosphate pyrophosphorylase
VDYIQIREKDLSGRQLETLARAAVALAAGSSSRILINSRTDVAIACGADGVHLRSRDLSPGEVRAIWSRSVRARFPPVVSVSCHSAMEVADAALAADFALFGPVFEKKHEPRGLQAGLDALHTASQQAVPTLALGGVNLDNAASCREAGAAGVAAIRLFQQREVAPVVSFLRQLP